MDRGLRVAHLAKYYPPAPGGMETHVQTLARAQAACGLEVSVLALNHEKGPTTRERDGSVSLTRLRRIANVAKLDVCPGSVAALRALDVDLIHWHVPNPTFGLALLAARPRAPLVVTHQSDLVDLGVRAKLFSPLERRLYERARAIFASSEAYAASSPVLREHAARTRVVPLGLDLVPFLEPSEADRAEAARIQARHAGPLWLACGRLVRYKALEVAIDALHVLPGTLLVAGEGPERARLEARARDRRVAGRVDFVGHVPRTVPYYLAATALLFPSNARSEAFGLVQVEALASGCPVINANVPGSGVPWVSSHEVSGLTVPVDDARALAAAARRLLDEPGLREKLATGARERARAELGADAMTRRTLAVYREVLGLGEASGQESARAGAPAAAGAAP